MRIRYGFAGVNAVHPLPGFSRAAKGDREHTENRHALWTKNAWLSAQCILTRAVNARNKEGKSLSRIPATSPSSDIALRSPIAPRTKPKNINLVLCRALVLGRLRPPVAR